MSFFGSALHALPGASMGTGTADWYSKSQIGKSALSAAQTTTGLGLGVGLGMRNGTERLSANEEGDAHESGTASKRMKKRSTRKYHDLGEPHPTAAFEQPVGPLAVPHAHVAAEADGGDGAGDAQMVQYLALKKVNRLNFLINHGITITDAEDVDLDHTSCEEDEPDEDGADPTAFEVPQVAAKRRKAKNPDEETLGSEDSLGASRNAPAADSSYRPESAAGSRAQRSPSRSASRSVKYDSAAATYFAGQPDDDDDDDDEFNGGGGEADADDEEESESLVRGGEKPTLQPMHVVLAEQTAKKAPPKKRKPVAGDHGSVSRMNDCFLCRWGQHEYDAVNNSDMQQLLRLIYDNIGEVDTPFIALAVHAFYKNVIQPAAVSMGQWLPNWRSKQIFVCIETHNFHPEIKLARDIRSIDIVQSALERKLFVQNPQSDKADFANSKLFKPYCDVLKLKWVLYGVKTSAMNFHRTSKDIQLGADKPRFKGVRLRNTAEKRKKLSAIGLKR